MALSSVAGESNLTVAACLGVVVLVVVVLVIVCVSGQVIIWNDYEL